MGPATKFGDAAKAIYLENLREHGQKAIAAEIAGVSFETVRLHRKDDKEFAAAEDMALKLRSQHIVRTLEREAIEGFKEPLFDKKGLPIMVTDVDGKVCQAFHRKVETPLRAMVLKRHAPEYRDQSEVTHKHQGGVLVMPTPVKSTQDWAALVAEANKTKEEA